MISKEKLVQDLMALGAKAVDAFGKERGLVLFEPEDVTGVVVCDGDEYAQYVQYVAFPLLGFEKTGCGVPIISDKSLHNCVLLAKYIEFDGWTIDIRQGEIKDTAEIVKYFMVRSVLTPGSDIVRIKRVVPTNSSGKTVFTAVLNHGIPKEILVTGDTLDQAVTKVKSWAQACGMYLVY